MKKFLSMFLALVMMLQLSMAAFAAAPIDVKLDTVEAAAGDTVTITISFEDTAPVKSMMITPQYDENALEMKSGKWNGDVSDMALLSANWSKKSGNAVLAFEENTDISGVVFEMKFAVKSGSKVSAEIIAKTMDENGDEVDIDLNVIDGAVTTSCSHVAETVKGKAATCTEAGLTDGSKCSVCGEVLTEQKEIPAIGHKAETVKGTAATCTEAGLTDGSKCSVCGEVLKAQEEIPVKAHSFKDGKCSVCGAKDPNYVEPKPEDPVDPTPTPTPGDKPTPGAVASDFSAHYDSVSQTLIVRGHGAMPTFDRSFERPWQGKEIKTLIIEEGITSVTKEAFGWYTVDTIYLPKSLVYLEEWALYPGSAYQVHYAGSEADFDKIYFENEEDKSSLLNGGWRNLHHNTPVPNNPFKDVKEADWFYGTVMWAVRNEITGGTSATTFSPNAPCTRAAVVTFLWAANGRPEPTSTDNPFKDVKESDWYYKAVLWAVGNGITGGTSATTFSPNDPCTRAQVVTFLYAAQGKPGVDMSANDFNDVADTAWFAKPVVWAKENEITGGVSAGKFGPNQTCTRAQIATFLYKAVG